MAHRLESDGGFEYAPNHAAAPDLNFEKKIGWSKDIVFLYCLVAEHAISGQVAYIAGFWPPCSAARFDIFRVGETVTKGSNL